MRKIYLWVGLAILTGSLSFAFIGLSNAEAVPIWFGVLSLAALKVVGYLSSKLEHKPLKKYRY